MLAGAGLHFATLSTDAGSALCLSRRLFHLPCPGCGLTRAFLLLAKGEWKGAGTMHPLAPLLAAEILAAWIGWGVWLAVRRSERSGRPVRAARALRAVGAILPLEQVLWAHAALLIALWLGRAATGTLPW